jgi:putative membrane-bound dehydrogenase-like protein
MRRLLLLVPFLLLPAFAAEPKKPAEIDYAKELPRIPPTEPADALKKFVMKPGYKVELVASEPQIASPVAAAWDENSRLYVVEMRGYSENRDEKLSRVKLLDSTKGDGVYDKAIVFADGLLWPTAVACWDGGVFVGDAPHIYYLKDTDGDGKADVKKIVYTGFGTHNVQGLLNTFLWTLDNRIHGSASSCGGTISRPDDKNFKPVNVNGRDFDFDPRTLDLRPTSGGAQHGMTFDDWGHKFVSSNSDHIQQVMYEDRYIARNPYLIAPPPRVSIATDGPQAEVFPAAPVEPWRAVRTRLRVQGITPGIVEGGGRSTGYFTGATGVTIYRGDAAPDLKGQAFIGDACSSLVHRKKLTLPEGSVQYRADRIDKDSEFLASKDNWFRPVQFANGPDGCLTVIDMYRETIEHPASLPPVIKKHLDLTSGRDRGRLWRVVPEGHTPRTLPKLGAMTTAQLVDLLDHPNAWHRETASRLLYERQDKAAVPALVNMHESVFAYSEYGHVHALYALHGITALKAEQVRVAMSSKYPVVREHAFRLTSTYPDAIPNAIVLDEIWQEVEKAKDAQVRYQFLFTFGDHLLWSPPLFHLSFELKDTWSKTAFLSSLTGKRGTSTPGQVLSAISNMVRTKPNGDHQVLADLATMISRRDDENDVWYLTSTLKALKQEGKSDALLLRLVKAVNAGGGKKAREGVSKVIDEGLTGRLLKASSVTASDEKARLPVRVEAVQSLSLGKLADVRDTLVKLLDLRQPGEVQLAALGVLDRFNDPALPETLLKNWQTLSPRLRAAAGETLLAKPDRVTALLDAIEKKMFAPQNLDATQIKRLTAHKDAAIQKRAAALLAAFKPARRTDVVEKYRPALDRKGDAAKGKAVFAKTCAACHKLEGVGQELGPNLSAMKNRGVDAILSNVLDPNAEVNPQYLNYTCNLDDGRTVAGMIQAETATSVTFVRGEGLKDTVARSNIESMKSTGLSLMPEGLEKDVSVEAMADLIAYIMQVP